MLIGGDTNIETGLATSWRAANSRRRPWFASSVPFVNDRPIDLRPLTAATLAESVARPAVTRLGFQRLRRHYTVAAITDAYVEAMEAVLYPNV